MPVGKPAPVSQLYFEDFTPAACSSTARAALPREEMIAFAAEFDPQPMHLDEAAAQRDHDGRA